MRIQVCPCSPTVYIDTFEPQADKSGEQALKSDQRDSLGPTRCMRSSSTLLAALMLSSFDW
jgi:hypothetical protein